MHRKIGIVLFLVWFPFLLMNDFFPFFRFGMFAEPIQKNSTQELFVLYYSNQKNTVYKFDTYQLGLDEGVFNYLARKYYYQNKKEELGKKLQNAYQKAQNSSKQDIKKWYLYRLEIISQKRDSLLVATYEHP